MAPPPPLGPLPGEKSPSTRPKYTARQPPAPGPPARHFPLPPPGPERCQPRHVPSRENQLPRAVRRPPGSVAAASALRRSPARGWGRWAGWLCTNWVPALRPLDGGLPRPPPGLHALRGIARSVPLARSLARASLPASVSGSATALLAESARVWASLWSPRPGHVPVPPSRGGSRRRWLAARPRFPALMANGREGLRGRLAAAPRQKRGARKAQGRRSGSAGAAS